MMIEWDVLIHVMAERRRDPYEADSRQGPRTRCGAERERGERRLRSRVKQGFVQASLVMIIRARDDLSVQPFQTPIFFLKQSQVIGIGYPV